MADVHSLEEDKTYLNFLYSCLSNRQRHIKLMNAWYRGDAPIPFPDNIGQSKAVHNAWKNLQQVSRVNAATLLVDARLPRILVHSVQSAVDRSADGDDEIERFMQESDFKLKLTDALRDTLTSGRGYLALTEDGLMRLEPSRTYCDVDSTGKTVGAVTMYVSSDRKYRVLMFARPGYYRIARAELNMPLQASGEFLNPGFADFSPAFGDWDWSEAVHTEEDSVPIYELADQEGIIKRHLPTLQRINHTILQLGVLIATQAYRKTVLKNAPRYDEEGNEIEYSADLFETAPDALLALPEGVDIWESSTTDLNPIRNVILDNLRMLAAESKTPLSMLTPDSAAQTAEGASTMTEPLVFDIEALEMRITSCLRSLFADAMRLEGHTDRADATKINIDWANPKRPSDVERMSAVQLATSAGVPLTVALRKFGGFNALDVAEVERVQGNEALRNLVVANATSSFNQRSAQDEEQPPAPQSPAQDDNQEPTQATQNNNRNQQVLNNTSPRANRSNQRNGGAV